MSADLALVRAYLDNVHAALQNRAVAHAQAFLEEAQKLLPSVSHPLSLPMQMNVGVGLNTGIKRRGRPNEDFAFAATGVNTQSQETYGLFLVADGMGGHANGQEASRLAIETIVERVLPFLHQECAPATDVGDLLVTAVSAANTAIYERNQAATTYRLFDQMGTTITAVVVFGPRAFIANVGDSRTYLYRTGAGLRVMTHDHSVVAALLACGKIAPEEIYTHPERNKILRCLGASPTVEVDLFTEQLQDGDILLLCSDGLWELTRDHPIEHVLASSWLSAQQMVNALIQAALQSGGRDNIGLVISQVQMQVTAMQTLLIPAAAS
jgi:serine/threonine protein phosphatase PrpC